MTRYDFRPVEDDDMHMLRDWLARPHVAEWWDDDDDDPLDEDIPEGGDIRKWVVSLEGEPIAYLQDYRVHAWADHPFSFLDPGARGIDMYIGPADFIGCGHGSAMVRQHALKLIDEGAPQVAIDPHPDNIRAVRAYENAGFEIVGPARNSPWGRFVPMVFPSAAPNDAGT